LASQGKGKPRNQLIHAPRTLGTYRGFFMPDNSMPPSSPSSSRNW
jgi:hypothetical protein